MKKGKRYWIFTIHLTTVTKSGQVESRFAPCLSDDDPVAYLLKYGENKLEHYIETQEIVWSHEITAGEYKSLEKAGYGV